LFFLKIVIAPLNNKNNITNDKIVFIYN